MSTRLEQIAEREASLDERFAKLVAAQSDPWKAEWLRERKVRIKLNLRRLAALARIAEVRDGNGWREVPVGVLNEIEAMLRGEGRDVA